MTSRTSLRAVALLLILVGWSTANLTIQAQKNAVPGQVTTARIISAGAAGAAGKESAETAESNNWLAHGRTFDEQRFSPLSQINASNVGQLALAWHYKLDVDRGTEATPLVVDGVMYTTGAFSIVYAIDARTGRLRWKYDPQVPRDWAVRACCDAVNRGVAIWESKVYLGTLDGFLVALDAATGRVAWRVDTLIDRSRLRPKQRG